VDGQQPSISPTDLYARLGTAAAPLVIDVRRTPAFEAADSLIASAFYRSPDDVYYASDGHCTHEKTLLCDGLVMGGVIECPKHNGRFDYTSGKALGAPVLVDVRTYPAKVIDGTVYIEVG